MSDATVLYDAPGPRARLRNLVVALVGAVVLAVALVVLIRAMAAQDQLTAAMWSPFLQVDSWTAYLIPGLLGTLTAAAISVVLSIVFGVLLGMGRLSELRPVRWLCGAFVEFFRAVPVLIMMLFAYFFGLFGLQISGDALPLFGVIVGLTFYNSCVIAELVRSGVYALPRGQREAGLALGLSSTQTLISVQLPQAVAAMLPSIISQLVVILKDSALGYNIVYLELLRQGQNLATYRGNLIPTLIVLAAIYIVINFGLSRLAGLVEQRLRVGKRAIKAGPEAGFVVMEETAADEGVVAPAEQR
jgi:glutamate transport system permease protein